MLIELEINDGKSKLKKVKRKFNIKKYATIENISIKETQYGNKEGSENQTATNGQKQGCQEEHNDPKVTRHDVTTCNDAWVDLS